jgi:hypothetical protein
MAHGSLTNTRDKALDDLVVHISFQESEAHFSHCCIYVSFCQLSTTLEVIENSL